MTFYILLVCRMIRAKGEKHISTSVICSKIVWALITICSNVYFISIRIVFLITKIYGRTLTFAMISKLYKFIQIFNFWLPPQNIDKILL